MKLLFAGLLALVLIGGASAQQREPSNYSTFKGEPFFLLSDASYGSLDEARVRLEVPGRDMGRMNLEAYSGADIVVYRVPEPMEFLKKQRNLHRIQVEGNYQGEGLANTLSFLWDSWWKQSRLAWRKLFSGDARRAVTKEQPQLATNDAIRKPTVFANHPQYKPIKGMELVDSFRYPIWQAKAIAPPKGVKLDGSSSDFIVAGAGNVMIPLGKRKPGLYLIEAIIGEHRATTLVFVSDTVAVTKVSSGQMLVWTARRDNSAAVAGASVAWTDGTGVLQSATTGADGVASLERGSPEHTYVLGQDRDGGVFVSENFYYDSEIYNTKIYAVTDRPLYRPGDEVNVKFLGREFTSARASQAAASAPLSLTVLNPNGTPLLTQTLQLSGDTGADTRFRLPTEATAGGYELRFNYKDGAYGAAFRVAEYVKPHFEINVQPSKPEFKTGEAVKGSIALRYPDGKPVKNAKMTLSLRSQQNTMVEGELRYSGLFPVALKTEEVTSDGSGNVDFTLPPAADPSRYILTVLATDGAAYRVKTTRELMIERSSSSYQLKAVRQFSDPGQNVHFDLVADGQSAAKPVRWEMVQLEKQSKTEGAFDPAAKGWDVTFPASGSYQLALRDERGNLLAAASHWVSGDGVQATPGSIEIVLDRARYRPGDTAEALITFSDKVDQALFTLERDKVEHHGLMAGAADWYQAKRVAPRQWRVRIPVKEEHGPNMTFSVAYTRNGDFVFENAGLQVIEPRIALQFKSDKEVYQPGEKVTLDVKATLDGKPLSTLVALGVVDEMIYVLQPEIAPDIGDFFYHPRRNNVRTTASLSFISYDMAQGRTAGAPARHNYNERGVKVLERPRRDNIDTAYWSPSLKTDANGNARVSFIMPDALTRWRITGRAMDEQGRVGQRTAYLRSDKNYYAKWTAPDWMRAGDAPRASVAVFNQTGKEQALDVVLSGGAGGMQAKTEKLTAKPGVNYVEFPLAAGAAGPLRLEVKQNGKLVDALDTAMQTLPAAWSSPRTLVLPLDGAAGEIPLKLPADARNIRLSFAQGAASHFARIADDLIDYPYGCVEQTASRLIPLALATQSLGADAGAASERLQTLLTAQRLRLVSMAGPNAVFGWWGNATAGNALMTAYAYYADWYAARALRIELPPEHWNKLLAVYSEHGLKDSMGDRALVLWMAREMGLPTQTLAAGLVDDSAIAVLGGKPRQAGDSSSLLLGGTLDREAQAMSLGLVALVAAQNGIALPHSLQLQVPSAWQVLRESKAPVAQALLMLAGEVPATQAEAVLASVRAEMPTLDRAMTLLWVQKKLGGASFGKGPAVAPDGAWQKRDSRGGQPLWRWSDAKGLPDKLRLAASTPAPAGTVAVLQYDSHAAETQTLPVTVERRILRMKTGKGGYTTELVKPGEALSTDALYLDEITLKAAAGAKHRFGLLEVALPPGAMVESTTWGMVMAGDKPAALERARHAERRDGYAVPIEPLAGDVTVRHLIRFAQKGSYVLPPARFYRMYQPEQKAFEGGGKTTRVLKVE
ncbi:MG2 domain protein [Janthinobacterium sp. MP5059B]|uniref:alpha-2-macroglobulin family protein n=1 Tax=Janthinobacterium sp. MP5059B TaxID=1766683 RepID=UPI00089368D7|nr:alpha-2-macroglobulin [Janthinobacterium sp. MP5059B]OEZ49235.1 MG2 domain protein [Janthinobacterium sp. MP5059B]